MVRDTISFYSIGGVLTLAEHKQVLIRPRCTLRILYTQAYLYVRETFTGTIILWTEADYKIEAIAVQYFLSVCLNGDYYIFIDDFYQILPICLNLQYLDKKKRSTGKLLTNVHTTLMIKISILILICI